MSHHLLRICAVDRSSHSLSNDYQHLAQSHQKSLLTRATIGSSRLGRHRAHSAPATPFRSRRQPCGSHSFQQLQQRQREMASQQEVRRRSSTPDRSPSLTESAIAARVTATTTTFAAATPDQPSRAQQRQIGKLGHTSRSSNDAVIAGAALPRSLSQDGSSSGRHSRATSTASRPNRLSLTLPIALPNGDLARIIQSPIAVASAVTTSIPPTPLETPNVAVPPSANDFIIAIAAQERRVFELKEELARAETELARLKKQWTAEEFYRKRSDSQRTDSSRCAGSIEDEALTATKRSIELDRRKLLLQTQQNSSTPSNRRVFRGSHARTLSLLSPTKTDTDEGFPSHDNSTRIDAIVSPLLDQRPSYHPNSHLTKRATWQPRSQPTPSANVTTIPQMMEEFKHGFRAFVEDIRQITIGDEPVAGHPRPISGTNQRGSAINHHQFGEPASPCVARSARTKTNSTSTPTHTPRRAEESGSGLSTATQIKTPELKPKGGKIKNFSWTPLGVETLDDTDWSNWDSPQSTKSARWSGSTVHSHGLDEIQSISETGGEKIPARAKKSAAGENPLISPTLEETFPNIVGRLSPGNIKRIANNLMDEWEKSPMTPESHDKVNCA